MTKLLYLFLLLALPPYQMVDGDHGIKYVNTCIRENAGWTWCYTIEFLKNPRTLFACSDLAEVGYVSRMCIFAFRLNFYD